MTKNECLKYLHILLTDAQHIRSVTMEGGGTIEIQQTLNIEPWLFSKNNIVTTLPKIIDRFEANDDDTIMELKTAVMNFSHIARNSQLLRIASVSSKRHDPTIEEIFDDSTK